MILEIKINSIGEMVDSIREIRGKFSGSVWFRGQSVNEWTLMPGLLRSNSKVSETTLLNRFKQSAAMLAGMNPNSTFDWVFLMQHYGVPTRLLDWSESPLVALYFALNEIEAYPEKDAAVWVLSPSDLNKNANIVDKDEADYIPSFDDDEVQGYKTEAVAQQARLELLPIATIATRNNPRIQAQLGTFTIHHNKLVPIEDVGDGNHVAKLLIPSAVRKEFHEELALLGINRFSLFPELESIGGILKDLAN